MPNSVLGLVAGILFLAGSPFLRWRASEAGETLQFITASGRAAGEVVAVPDARDDPNDARTKT